ncbi:hypothetical protein GCM10010216_72460 [Streptomyces flaveolus]|nr:hypothetical protein GCM10010216_72460 [Streptomyces flaveolus]
MPAGSVIDLLEVVQVHDTDQGVVAVPVGDLPGLGGEAVASEQTRERVAAGGGQLAVQRERVHGPAGQRHGERGDEQGALPDRGPYAHGGGQTAVTEYAKEQGEARYDAEASVKKAARHPEQASEVRRVRASGGTASRQPAGPSRPARTRTGRPGTPTGLVRVMRSVLSPCPARKLPTVLSTQPPKWLDPLKE